MPAIDKTMAPIVVDYDWKKEISAIALAFKSMGVDFSQTLTAKGNFTMFGDKKMTAKQREIFEKMNQKQFDAVRKRAISDSTAEIKKLKSVIDKINTQKIILVKKGTQIDIEVDKCIERVKKVMAQANEDYVAVVENNIKGYLKGRARKAVKIRQTVKHSIKTPLAIAAVPAGIALAATGLGAPIGIVLCLKALQSMQATHNFIRRHRGGIKKMEEQIARTIPEIEARSDEFAALAEKAEHDPDARKQLGIMKSKIGKKEAIAYGYQTFLKVNKASIGKLDYLLDKYQKKVNQLKYRVVGTGKKIDKLKAEIEELRKDIVKRKKKIKEFPDIFKGYGYNDTQIQAAVNGWMKKNDEIEKKFIPQLNSKVKILEDGIDDQIDECIAKEAQLNEWAAKVALFKSQRPQSLQHWKKAMKILDFVSSVGSSALGGASDVVSPAETAVQSAIGIIGYIDDGSDYIINGVNEVTNQIAKHK